LGGVKSPDIHYWKSQQWHLHPTNSSLIMTEHADEGSIDSQKPVGREELPEAGLALETSRSHYLKIIDNARKAVAITMGGCGLLFVLCVNRDDYLTETLRREPGIWAWGKWIFGIGVLICLVTTLAFIIEYLARPAAPNPIKFRSMFIRSLFIISIIAAIFYAMLIFYGFPQAIGATTGVIILLAAVKKVNPARAIIAVLAVIVLGLTLLSTQTTYQYACRHADEIVAAGCELMDQQPAKQYIHEADIDDKQVPSVLRKLGVRSILVDEEYVSIYVPGNSVFTDREFIIYRIPNPSTWRDSVFIRRPTNKDEMYKINDRLWMTDY
jgi:hypothetical protein